jgi:hypothetical protein
VLTINNDPSWITTASGHALVGAAFLEPADIKGFFSITPEPGYECSSLRRQGHITLTLKLYRDDRFRWIALSRDSLDLLEH